MDKITRYSAEQRERWRRTAHARERERQRRLADRRRRALASAIRAATSLKAAWGASRVVLFGSVAHGAWFHERSDIDLAAAGIPADQFWRASVAAERAVDRDIELTLIPLETASEGLLDEIDKTGVELP